MAISLLFFHSLFGTFFSLSIRLPAPHPTHLDWRLHSVALVAGHWPVHQEQVQLLDLQLLQDLLDGRPHRILSMVLIVQLQHNAMLVFSNLSFG